MAILFVGVLEKTVLISKSMTSQEFEGIAADLQPTASQLQIVKDKLSIYYKKIIGEIYILVICQTQHPRQLVLALIEDLSERLGSEEAQLIKIESMSIDYKKIMEKYQGSQANIISNITGSNTNANNL